jgi:2-C-methyl-D-erythritol 2,4-cyclodiphosphate synthase
LLPLVFRQHEKGVMETALGIRTGLGYDLHRLAAGRPLVLGGVRIPHDCGLLGHSDADVVLHAVSDALLGAAGLGDIGELFPDSDPAWRNADSRLLVAEVLARVGTAGFRLLNVDVVIHAQQPRLGPLKADIKRSLSSLLGLPADAVGVKATTNEGLDAVGRGEAIACWAAVLIIRRP